MTNSIRSRVKAWYEDGERNYSFPENWYVNLFSHGRQSVLVLNEIRDAIQQPVGCLPLASHLTAGMKICIVCDDISRPTRTDIILPIILDILKDAGISPAGVQIVVASGTHIRMTAEEKRLKFGEEVCRKVDIVDHKGNNLDTFSNI